MSHNNRKTQQSRFIVFLYLIILVLAGRTHKNAKIVQDVSAFELESAKDKYLMNIQIAHHHFKLTPKVATCRSWLKEALCQVCDTDGESCDSKKSCFASSSDPKISCDVAYCSKTGDYQDPEKGIYGIDTQMFCTEDKNKQVLMPLVLAKKITVPGQEMGDFCILDSESSFNKGLIVRKKKVLQIVNGKMSPDELKQMKDYSFESKEVTLEHQQSIFGPAVNVKVQHYDPEIFKTIEVSSQNGLNFQFSLTQLGISMPAKYTKQIEEQILSQYFSTNNCHFQGGKLKCNQELKFGSFTESVFNIEFKNNFVFSIPVHMLFSACTAKQCTFLLSSHNENDLISVGTIVWDALALQWDLDSRKIWIHRLNNHWAAPYNPNKMDFTHRGFLYNLLMFLFHIVLYTIYIILGLALVSILINCAFKWREVLRYMQRIITKIRRRNMRQIAENQKEEDYFVSGVYDNQTTGRRMNRLPDQLEDQL